MRPYFIGISWFILSLISSTANDIISKYLGGGLKSSEIAFFRFLFSTLSLLPFIFYHGIKSISTSHTYIHLIRGAILFVGMSIWIYGLQHVQVTTATIIGFSTPLFVLMLGSSFLKEKVIWQRWAVTLIGLIGVMLTLLPNIENSINLVVILSTLVTLLLPVSMIFKIIALIVSPLILTQFSSGDSSLIWNTAFIITPILFASLDIINKHFVVKESILSMMFYSSLVTTLAAIPFIIHNFIMPNLEQTILLLILGMSANLILFFILKAYAYLDVTALSPYRYLELIFSALGGYLIFGDIPHQSTYYGAALLIPSTLFIIYSEQKTDQRQQK